MLKILYFPICWLVQILVYKIISLQVIDNALDSEKMIDEYEGLTSDLLEWIEQTIVILNDRQFANSLTGVQQQLAAFSTYRIVEKPPKWVLPHIQLIKALISGCWNPPLEEIIEN